jgi:hypothetical protein
LLAARRRTRRLRQSVALLLVAVGATIYAACARSRANDQRDLALSQKVAGEGAALRTADPALAAQLSLAAYRLAPTVEARSGVLSTITTPYATLLFGHVGNVEAAAYSPDGRLVEVRQRDGAVVRDSSRILQTSAEFVLILRIESHSIYSGRWVERRSPVGHRVGACPQWNDGAGSGPFHDRSTPGPLTGASCRCSRDASACTVSVDPA